MVAEGEEMNFVVFAEVFDLVERADFVAFVGRIGGSMG
jgi:hypothetical protein